MGETPRRSGFRLPWSEAGESKPDQPATDAAVTGTEAAADEGRRDPAVAPADAAARVEAASQPSAATAAAGEPSPFLRELVEAMRGVAETSRDTSLAELRSSLDERIEGMRAAAAEHVDDLRRRSDHDVTTIGEWERTEIERIRAEAEQRRDARRAKLERELADHQAASEREMESARRRVSDYERELGAFFAELTEIRDPATFVATAKRMPAPPDLGGTEAPSPPAGPEANGAAAPRSEMTLSQRLAQLDQQLAASPMPEAPEAAEQPAAAAEAGPEPEPAEPAVQAEPPDQAPPQAATEAPDATAPAETPATPTPPPAGQVADALTPIVVKGLGSFGAITSFKQALERVDGVRGVTLSLGPTGEFVYRASHAPEFDIVAAIRQIEGPGAGIDEAEGQVLVTIERQR